MMGTLIRWFQPAPDSAVANVVRRGKSPWTDAVHLMWSIWVFALPALGGGHYDARWLWLTLASYPLFLLLYARTLLAPRRRSPLYAYAMAALGIGLLAWYPSGISYYVFGCVMLRTGSGRFLLSLLPRLVALNAVFVAVALHIGYPPQVLFWMPAMTIILGIVINVERVGHEKDAALKLSHDEVRRLAALAERERIGRDLHDLLGHTLSLVALKSELAARLLDSDAGAARRELAEVGRVARDALAQVRSAVTGIRSAGLAAELASARLLLETDRIAFDYVLAPVALPPEIEQVLALSLREAVTNIQRHARARSARAELAVDGGDVVLDIRDDGRGGAMSPGNGLCGMRERIEALGGRLRVESMPGRGACIEARLPLPRVVRGGVPGQAPAAAC
jgi:two-component system, NarL family, sensor histidine kinase DesK